MKDPDQKRIKFQRIGVNRRSSAAAEKSGEGMALKICTGAKPFLKALHGLSGHGLLLNMQAGVALRKKVQRFKMSGHVEGNSCQKSGATQSQKHRYQPSQE
jgi:hypothetical protein